MSLFQTVNKNLISNQTEQIQLAQEQAKAAYVTEIFQEKSIGIADSVSNTKYFIVGFIVLAISGFIYMETRNK